MNSKNLIKTLLLVNTIFFGSVYADDEAGENFELPYDSIRLKIDVVKPMRYHKVAVSIYQFGEQETSSCCTVSTPNQTFDTIPRPTDGAQFAWLTPDLNDNIQIQLNPNGESRTIDFPYNPKLFKIDNVEATNSKVLVEWSPSIPEETVRIEYSNTCVSGATKESIIAPDSGKVELETITEIPPTFDKCQFKVAIKKNNEQDIFEPSSWAFGKGSIFSFYTYDSEEIEFSRPPLN